MASRPLPTLLPAADEDYANVMSAQAAALGQLVRDAEEARRAMNSEVLRRNLEMAAEQRDRQSHEQAMEQMTNEAEIDYHRNVRGAAFGGTLLAGADPGVGLRGSCRGPCRTPG